jgi:hypothetical protein
MTVRPSTPGMPGEDDEVSPACDNRHPFEEPGGNLYAPPVAGGLQGPPARGEGPRLLTWLTATEGRVLRVIAMIGVVVTMVFFGIGAANVEVEVTPGSIHIAPAGSVHVAPIPVGDEPVGDE